MIGLSVVNHMADSQDVSLVFDTSRCHRSRFRKSDCRSCVDSCIRTAITLEAGKVFRDPGNCSECMTCTSECPGGAFTSPRNWHWKLIRFCEAEDQPLVGCQRTMPNGFPGVIPCIGLLSETMVVALTTANESGIYIDIAGCSGCENSHTLSALNQKIDSVSHRLGLNVRDKLWLITDKREVSRRHRSIGRRRFFGDLKQIIGRTLVSSEESPEVVQAQPFSNKKRSTRSRLIEYALSQSESELRRGILNHFCYWTERTDSCRLCGKCAAICPTGAIKFKREGDFKKHDFHVLKCDGCGLCQSFCRQEALSVVPYFCKESDPESKRPVSDLRQQAS